MTVKEWHGTDRELLKLREAVDRNCECGASGAEGAIPTCPAHTLFLDQNVLDHLLYVYRAREGFKHKEFEAVA